MQKVHTFVNNLQSRSVQERKTILVGVSVGVTALIALIWIVSFSSGAFNAPTDSAGINQKQGPSPFALVKDSVVELYASATTGYNSATSK